MILIRVKSLIEAATRLFTATARQDETVDGAMIQHYGFASSPPPGCVGLAVADGQLVYLIATDSPDNRPALAEGEACLYTEKGDVVHLQADGTITVTASNAVVVVAPVVSVDASTSVSVASPMVSISGVDGAPAAVTLTGTLTVNGSIAATGTISTPSGSI